MNIRDLKYFVAVAELEHFGRAAEQCYVSQPTLSGQIKKLESTLGVTLFERTNRKVMLTEIGHQILRHAKQVLAEVDTLQEAATYAGDPLGGKFRLGAFPTLAPYFFPSIVPKIKESLPQLRLILMEEKTDRLIEHLKDGTLDAAFLALPVEDGFLISQALFEDEFVLALPPGHPWGASSSIDQHNLQDQTLLLLEEGHCLRDQSLDVCGRHGVAEEQDFKATSLETLRQMVKAGTGMTFMPAIAIHRHEKGIHYVPFNDPKPFRSIGLVWRKTTTRQAVIDELMALFE